MTRETNFPRCVVAAAIMAIAVGFVTQSWAGKGLSGSVSGALGGVGGAVGGTAGSVGGAAVGGVVGSVGGSGPLARWEAQLARRGGTLNAGRDRRQSRLCLAVRERK